LCRFPQIEVSPQYALGGVWGCGCGVDGRERYGEIKADNSILQSKTRQGKTGRRRRLGELNLDGKYRERKERQGLWSVILLM
jgi:hypothetical protein